MSDTICSEEQTASRERGAALFLVTMLALIATLLLGTFLSTSLGKVRHAEQQAAEASAFNAAESGLNAVIAKVWNLYRNDDPKTRVADLDLLDGKQDTRARVVLARQVLGSSQFTAQVVSVRVPGTSYADVEFSARGENGQASRTLRAVVRFGHEESQVFDHGYFINNYGWLWGAGITVNGSVRSNGNFSVDNATINGDIYASENPALGAAGTIEGGSRNDPLDYYNDHADEQVRPSNPSATPEDANGNGVLDPGEDLNGNGVLDTFALEDGYNGKSKRNDHLPALDMPYLGDLTTYRDLAIEQKGTISQGGTVVVNGVLGDDSSEPKNLLLVGTPDNPIVLNGPVVIENDVVLRGTITGRGTIYAGRNVHIIGDLSYANPPSWPKPLVDPDAARAHNATADLVGLAAKGSVILGDYTVQSWQTTTRNYQRPSFTQPYEVDPTDDSIGYVSYYGDDGKPMFDGDYTAYDGGKKEADPSPSSPGVKQYVSRKFFESSFSDSVIHANAGNQVQHVDAVVYTNHLLSGKIGACTFNGTLVSRDEAIIYSGSIFINYDLRVRRQGYQFLDVYLPRVPTHHTLYWSESQ